MWTSVKKERTTARAVPGLVSMLSVPSDASNANRAAEVEAVPVKDLAIWATATI